MTLHTSITTTARVFSGTHQEYCMSEYLAPETKWRRVASNLRHGSKGSLYEVYCFTMRWRTLSKILSYKFNWHTQELLEGSRVFSSQRTHELVIGAQLSSSFWIQPWSYPDYLLFWRRNNLLYCTWHPPFI